MHCKTVLTLIRRRVLPHLICVYIVCQCPFYGTLGINGLMNLTQHCDRLVGETGDGCFVFFWSVACVLSVMVCLLFLLVSLVGYDLWVLLFRDILYTILNKQNTFDSNIWSLRSMSFIATVVLCFFSFGALFRLAVMLVASITIRFK